MGMMTRRNVKDRAVAKAALSNCTQADNLTSNESEEKKQNQYTKTDINRMPIADLRKLGEQEKIEYWHKLSGLDLKAELIRHFGL